MKQKRAPFISGHPFYSPEDFEAKRQNVIQTINASSDLDFDQLKIEVLFAGGALIARRGNRFYFTVGDTYYAHEIINL